MNEYERVTTRISQCFRWLDKRETKPEELAEFLLSRRNNITLAAGHDTGGQGGHYAVGKGGHGAAELGGKVAEGQHGHGGGGEGGERAGGQGVGWPQQETRQRMRRDAALPGRSRQ
jgi:hypothetical protein